MSNRRIESVILATALLSLPAVAQTVDLQGTVKDRYGTQAPIPDAEVTLLKAAVTVRTDAQGRFRLVNAPTRLDRTGLPGPDGFRWMPGRGLVFRNGIAGMVSIRILTLSGKSVFESVPSRLDAGNWAFYPPELKSGVFILSLTTREFRAATPIVQLGQASATGGGGSGFQRYVKPETQAQALAKPGAVSDTLRISKAGFFTTLASVPEYVQAGLTLTLADTTSSMASLKALFPSEGNLQPVFQAGLYGYSMIVRESVAGLGFTAITAPGNPFITIRNGTAILAATAGIPSAPIALNTGANTVEVEALSRDSTAGFTYRIDVYRVVDASAALTGLSAAPGDLAPAFTAGTLEYALALGSGVTHISLTPAAQPLSVIRIKGNTVVSGQASLPITVRVGKDTVMVEVTSPNGQVSAYYRVITTRAEDTAPALPSLASLKVTPAGGFTPAFDPAILKYDAWYPAGPSPITIVAVAANPAHKVAIQGRAASVGRDSADVVPGDTGNFAYGITVTDADGANPRIYTVTAHKGASSIAGIKKVEFSPAYASISPTFNPSLSFFNVSMNPGDSVVTITPTATHPSATIFFGGAVVQPGTGVTIKPPVQPSSKSVSFEVRAQDGKTEQLYSFHVSRYPVLGAPRISGPTIGYKGAVYTYHLALPSACKSSTGTYSVDFGDGTPLATGQLHTPNSSYDFNKVERAYANAGDFAYKLRTSCDGQLSDWSAPKAIKVLDPAQGGKYRQVSGPRSASEIWYKDTVYLISGPTLFEKATTLTIQPGTTVNFLDTAFYLMITGGLSAVGTATDSIRFEQANIRLRWKGAKYTYNPDGSYLTGPRFEYCSIPDGYIYIERTDTDGKGGPYLRHSRVKMITGEFFKYSNGSYIDHCRIDLINGMRLMDSRVLNSHIATANISVDVDMPMKMSKCDIPSLTLNIYDFTNSEISGNTFRSVRLGSSTPGKLRGNNILLAGKSVLQAGTGLWDMQQNFWGDSATAEMIAKGPNQNITGIKDYFDDLSLGKMDYSNWKTELIPDAKPDW